jgi:signal transduction histidine kinase
MDMEDENYDEVVSNLEKIGGLTQKLEGLMEDILELSKIDHIEDKFEEVDIKKELESIKENLSILMEENKIEMSFTLKGINFLYTSKNLINTVLENLISNAIKYSDPNKNNRFVKVEVSKDQAGSYIRVLDNGLGIPNKHMGEVFGMFKRFHKNTSFGSGLGLYIVKKNIQKIDGEIFVRSDAEGTVFTVFLPEKLQKPN